MSIYPTSTPKCSGGSGAIALRIEAREKNLGEFTVRRVLPASERQMVGPFIFFDHLGPAEFPPGKGIQVRPHPHIGLATITYLFEGEIIHRDSLGYEQPIIKGAVNLMTAGSGIVHSERAGDDLNSQSKLHGIQTWMALPEDQEEMEPAFVHYPASDLPEIDLEGIAVRVIVGEAYGQKSPVTAYSSMLYLECRMPKVTTLTLPDSYQELAAYVVTGQVQIENENYADGVMAVAAPEQVLRMQALQDSRVMVIGGQGLGERHIWWNFVARTRERIEKAKADWKAGHFDSVPDDSEFIPLPE